MHNQYKIGAVFVKEIGYKIMKNNELIKIFDNEQSKYGRLV